MEPNELINKIKELLGLKTEDASKKDSKITEDKVLLSENGLKNETISPDEADKENEVDEPVEDKKMAFKKPNIDKNGFIDLTEVEDADLKAFFKELNASRKSELAERKAVDDKRAVDDAIAKYASNLKFAEGWTLEDAKKLGDFSKVVNDDNLTKEIENAFTSLKSSKASMFVADKDNKETKTTSPITEKFNPINSENTELTDESLIEMAYGQSN